MKLTFPHMGNLYIPLRALFSELGLEVVVPPPSTRRTLNLGTRWAPEFACLPLKVNIGNFIEAFELGADTVIMGGGVGPCRFGYYGEVQREILLDLGYQHEQIVLEPPQGHFRQLLAKLGQLRGKASPWRVWCALTLAWQKIQAIDALEQLALYIRPRERNRGETTKVLTHALAELDVARSIKATKAAWQRGQTALKGIPRDPKARPLRIALVGEIYVVLEPFVNMQVETRLGEMGVEVTRTIYLGDWIRKNLLLDALRLNSQKEITLLANPYLAHFVGGHGLESVAHTVEFAQKGYAGIVHLAPFTCMPEIVAASILPRVTHDYQIPVLNLVLDENTGEAGVITRLEAFVDMLRSRQRKIQEVIV